MDLNENNVTISLPDRFIQLATHERGIRASYFVKRRKILKKFRTGKKRRKPLEKYGGRERNRVNDMYHKLANKLTDLAKNMVELP